MLSNNSLIPTLKAAAKLYYQISLFMNSDQVENDDVEINPVTMLLLDAPQHDQNGKPPATVTPNELQMQSYYISSIDLTVTIRSLPSQGLSFQLWPASTTLVNLLDGYASNPTTSPLSGCNLDITRPLRILELGSGTGVVGIAASAILGANVTITDLSHVLPNLRFNAEANSEVLAINGGSVNVVALDWGEVKDMESVGREYDLIVGSDVVYHDHLFEPLIETLKFLILRGENVNKEKKEVVFVMGHLKRWKKETAFFKMAKKYFEVRVIHADGPSIGSRVGVVVYRLVRKDASFG